MSHIKQSGQSTLARQPIIKSSQLTSRTPKLDSHPKQNGHVSTVDAHSMLRSVSTRNDAKHTEVCKPQTKRAVSELNVSSTNILKRSLSKLRIKDASPARQKPPSQSKRPPLSATSKIPQATAPATTSRILGARPEQSAFVLHNFTPLTTKQTNRQHHEELQLPPAAKTKSHQDRHGVPLFASNAIHQLSPRPDTKTTEIRMKAMQLGIFKISEADLKDRYQFLNEIGAGEWGSVWSVEALRPLDHLPSSAYRSLQVVKLTGSGTYTVDNSSNFRPLAVKLCKRETKYSSAARTQRLWNEFKVLRMLMDQLPRAEQVNAGSPNCRVRNDRTGWHPNVVNFYEFLLTPNLAMLVMPKFDEPMKVCLGESLCIQFFEQLLSALHWLHQHGICHNDIKVDNVGVTYDTSGLGRDMVTLFDFGFANRYDPLKEDAFMSKDVWGTPEYLSPERCRATLHDERKSDIWALGITFFEMLTGRTPFEHHDEKFDSSEKFEVYYSRAERGVWLGDWNMSSEMEDLIRKMLRHDPKERIDAAGALLHNQFDPRNGNHCDSFDELLQISYEDPLDYQKAEPSAPEPSMSMLQHELDDSDAMIQDLVEQTNQLDLQQDITVIDHGSPLASPGVSRALVATRPSHVPASPSLSQVGMDSRLTDLMCVSPPWRGPQPPRQGTPIPSAQRNRILAESLVQEADEENEGSDASLSDHSPVAITSASRASATKPMMIVPPTKQSPFRLRLGERPHRFLDRRPLEEQMTSTPVSAPAAIEQKTVAPVAPVMCPMSLPQVEQTRSKPMAPRTDFASRGNVVASLAKKFDATNFLARPPAHVTAMTAGNGLGLTIRGQPMAKVAHGHRRSKSYNLASSRQQGVARHSVRRSTGSFVPSPEEPLPRCARRLFDADVPTVQQSAVEADSATDIGSARSDTKDAGGQSVHDTPTNEPTTVVMAAARTPALHAVLSGDQPGSGSFSHSDSSTQHVHSEVHLASGSTPSLSTTPVIGEEIIFKKLKKMASLAGMLTKMIDETKSTILSPQKSAMKTPMRKRGSASTQSTEAMDISPGLLETPEAFTRRNRKMDSEAEDEGDVSLVSAAFSLDLSSSARRASMPKKEASNVETDPSDVQRASQVEVHQASTDHRSRSVKTPSIAVSDRALSIPPSPAQVETMYSSFLLSQNVSKSGSGFLSPAQPCPSTGLTVAGSIASGKSKHRSLAALFSPTSSIPTFEHLLQDASPQKARLAGRPVTATPVGTAAGPSAEHQRSIGKGRKLARLFRKQS
ncbi:related to CHK1-Serine/threonine kinase [Sporisorium reilianum f. sp. reilianum]|uniref:Related to CHK1-Serine/threonine kinase n=1 Tax=Sporisorium reilianum f. sp. reilianum TaxID=72559 RepID=A0A2N8U7W7_9BASI|nr:related to CHK1-Serine/threonine kinase [Sporisorium reilianum f. sp. reilianum]